MTEKFIAYKKEGVIDKSQGFHHESVFDKTLSEADILLQYAREGYITVLINREEVELANAAPTFKELKEELINIRKSYLSSTDWQAAAFIKYGRPLDGDVGNKCLAAIQEIAAIKQCASIKELEFYQD